MDKFETFILDKNNTSVDKGIEINSKPLRALETIERLHAENQRYKQALEELRQMSLNVSVEREEDGSIIPNHEAQLIFEITNKALGGNENE